MRVAVHLFEPLAFEAGGRLVGFDVELLDALADELDCDFAYEAVAFHEVFAGLDNGAYDLAGGGLTINAGRVSRFDFSYPYLRSGLGVLSHTPDLGVLSYVWLLLTSRVFPVLLGYVVFLVVEAHLIWFAERTFRRPEDDGPNTIRREYRHGITEAVYFAHSSATTMGFGDIVARSTPGRFVVMMSSVVGIAFAGVLFSEIGSFTFQYRHMAPTSVSALAAQRVVAVHGTTGERRARLAGAEVTSVEHLHEAFDAFERREVDHVVAGYPTLDHYAHSRGGIANPDRAFRESYGFAMPLDSPLRRSLDRALLQIREDGRYATLHEHWFTR